MVKQAWARSAARLAILAIACSTLSDLVTTAHADEAAKAHKEIQAVYGRLELAFKARDARALAEVCSEDYQVVLPDGGKLDRNRTTANYYRQMSAIQEVHTVHMQPEQWVDRGAGVIVTVTDSFTAKTLDARKTSHEISSVVHTRDTWAKQGSSWRLVHSEVRQQSLVQDGKTVLFRTMEPAKARG